MPNLTLAQKLKNLLSPTPADLLNEPVDKKDDQPVDPESRDLHENGLT